MTLGDELERLDELHRRGVLTDDEFSRAKARLLATPLAARAGSAQAMVNALRRSRQDRWLGGVCGGIAELTGVAAWAWRLMFVLLLMCAGTGVLAYGLLWLLVPLDDGLDAALALHHRSP